MSAYAAYLNESSNKFLRLGAIALFLVLLLVPALSTGSEELAVSPEAIGYIKELQSNNSKYDYHDNFEKHIINAVNSGNRTQALLDLQFVSTEMQRIDSASTYSSMLKEIMRLKILLSEKSNTRTINIHSPKALFDRNVYLAVRNEDNELYSKIVSEYAASASQEPHPVTGVGFGETYKFRDNSNSVWIGRIPVLIPLSLGENLFRVYFFLTHWDFLLHATVDDVTIQSVHYGTSTRCAEFAEGMEDLLKRETKALSGSKIKYTNKTARISIPLLQGANDRGCLRGLSYGIRKYYHIEFLSTPTGAKVYVDGKEFGRTPLELLIRRYFERFRVAFKKQGYYEKAITYYEEAMITKLTIIVLSLKQP